MISGINSYFAGVTAMSGVLPTKTEGCCRNSFGARAEDSKRVTLSEEGSPGSGVTSDADTKVTISGSVVYEPVSLLTDLSGSGGPMKMSDYPEQFSAGTHRQSLQKFLQTNDEAAQEPVTYTFEILV
jgi:hypothetical protein